MSADADGDGMTEETKTGLANPSRRRRPRQRRLAPDASELLAEIRRLRRAQAVDRPVGAWIAPLAALCLLRWAEHTDALTPRHRWSAWKDLPEAEFVEFVQGELVPALLATSAEPLGSRWQHLALVLRMWVDAWPNTIPQVLGWCNALDFGAAHDRWWAGEVLGIIADPVGGVGGPAMAECSTPQPIAELMVDLLDPRPGERIYDPCFGGGNLLAAVAKRLRDESDPASSVFGTEIDPHAYCIGLARVILAGTEYPQLEVGDALKRSWSADGAAAGFDGVLAVPPWGRRPRRDTWCDLPFAARNIETLFLQHAMTALRPGGRAVIALPDAALFRTGADKKVREHLLTNYHVDGVVSLPAGAFRPYTDVKTSLLVFRRKEATGAVRFLEVKDWPRANEPYKPNLGPSNELTRGIANRFVDGTPSSRPFDTLWETPVPDLTARDWELVPKRTGARALAGSLEALNELDSGYEFPSRPLHEVAEVFTGAGGGGQMTATHTEDAAIGTRQLSVADLRRRPVDPEPSRFLAPDREAVRPERRLRAGDLLLATSGKVGTVGIVRRDGPAVGAVAGWGLAVVRPREEMDSEFLLHLLKSRQYQLWLRGHARGVNVQHLPIRRLRFLPLPVPDVAFQRLISEQRLALRGGDDLLTSMMEWADFGYDPVDMWFHTFRNSPQPDPTDSSEAPCKVLQRTARSFLDALSQREESQSDGDAGVAEEWLSEIEEWLSEIKEPMGWLRDLSSVPAGAGRLAILDNVRFAIKTITMRYPWEDDELTTEAIWAYELSEAILPLVEVERKSILEAVRVESVLERDWIRVDAEDEVQLRITNGSLLALRNVEVATSPAVGSRTVPYLAEGEELTLPVALPADTPRGLYRFWVEWKADRLDGRRVSGEEEQAVHVNAVRETPRPADFGTSPYVVGSPVGKEMFFGREEIIDEVKRQLSTEHRANVVLLEGNRRTGKTSILKRLEERDTLPGWLTVYCSFQGGAGHASRRGLDTTEVFRLIARDVGWAAYDAGFRVWLPGVERPDERRPFKVEFAKALSASFADPGRAFELFELFLEDVLEAAQPQRILLMFDEFDKLQEGIAEGVTSAQVPENLRFLLHRLENVSAVLAGSRRLKRLREEYWSALFGLGHRISVSELSEASARRLVEEPVGDRLHYLPEATEKAIELCARQPFLIQSLCNRIFERTVRLDRRTVAVGDVEKGAEAMIEDNEHLHTLWGYAKTECRRFILALCQRLESGPDPVTLDLLETKFREYGVDLRSAVALNEDLESLRELELLRFRETERARGFAYGLTVPLMAEWIRTNIDFEGLRRRAVEEGERLR
ncbi:N-6 DNA methylase [Candidatus Palauibacter sp.]|uniref:N-6 DNA methylase n=1 Tax=Candidatus Palauibacter sp. TaxID=3101350 RepID=UPI003B02DE4D